MPQYDLYHDAVKQALIKDGWTITDDPFIIEFKGLRLYADLGRKRRAENRRRSQELQRPAIQEVIVDQQINLLVFEPEAEEVVQ